MAKPGLAPRRAALHLLGQVTGEGRLLAELLPASVAHLAPEDRARAQRLTLTALRWMDRADRMLGPYLRKRPGPAVLNALRLGVVELAVDGAAAHGVVDAWVHLMRQDRQTAGASGLVNAVLRRAAGDLEKWKTLPVPRLPKWLRAPLIDAYGKAVVTDIEAAHAAEPPLDLTAKGDSQTVARAVGGEVLPTGSIRITGRRHVTELPGYRDGDWWVQDAAAALPARMLAPDTGAKVLDMCAAPGGKTLQLAAMGAEVTALDVSEARLARVADNLARTGLRAATVAADALKWQPPEAFDAILLDAPCSATGTVRRHPDLPYAKDGADFAGLFALQSAMLDHAAEWLQPGGRLVFCTCSLLPDEGEVQVADALRRHRTLSVDPDAFALPGVPPEWRSDTGIRTRPDYWPDRGGLDGFFIAVLRKAA